MFCVAIAAVGVTASGCVVVSGNRAELSPGLMTSCGDHAAGGVHRNQVMEATSGFERLERIDVICADSGKGRMLLKVAGLKDGGGHGERTYVVRGEKLEPIS